MEFGLSQQKMIRAYVNDFFPLYSCWICYHDLIVYHLKCALKHLPVKETQYKDTRTPSEFAEFAVLIKPCVIGI